MVAEGVAAMVVATVAIEAVDPGEEGSEGFKLPNSYPLSSQPGSPITARIVTDSPVTNRRSVAHLIKGGSMNIYVGNLSLEMTEDELRKEFTAFGEVISVIIMNDKYIGSGQPRGYGFVEMTLKSEGAAAIASLKGKKLRNRAIDVVEALPLSDKGGIASLNIKYNNRSNKSRQRRYQVI
jgi:RNA recognition motif-containing protein